MNLPVNVSSEEAQVANDSFDSQSDYTFDLPAELIAQHPLAERDSSRLMLLSRASGHTEQSRVSKIADYLSPGDMLILNDTKVIPTKLIGRKLTGGRVEFLLTTPLGEGPAPGFAEERRFWEAMAKPVKGLRAGVVVDIDKGVSVKVHERISGSSTEAPPLFKVEIVLPETGSRDIGQWLAKVGRTPLPPYIKRSESEPDIDKADRERYQTVFASNRGAVAAPTAGLHFTPELIEAIKKRGVKIRYLTLHTGPGTFLPIRVKNLDELVLAEEEYEISAELFSEIMETKHGPGRVVAVGTTVTRAIESSVLKGYSEPKLSGNTGLFIRPGFEFKLVDALLTNFHLPGSTLIMLAAAFGGTGNVLNAYKEAVRDGYRFYSYGDCMFIS